MLPAAVAAVFLSLLEGLTFAVAYVTSGNAFPKPLSSEEEERYLCAWENGDTDARNVLIERNLRLVAHIAKKFDNVGQDSEDLISIGTLGLIKAINTFNRNKKTRLATYAARCIENEILMHLRTTRRLKSEVLLYDTIGSDPEGNEISLIDVLGSDADTVADQVASQVETEKLYEKLRNLTGRERRVLELRYGLANGVRRTQREISKLLGISRSYVSRIEKRAINKLHRDMYVDGLK